MADLALVDEGRLELYAYREPRGLASVSVGGQCWPTMDSMGETAFIDYLPTRINTAAVYITIDKDVLHSGDAVTNWDQGRTSLDLLEAMIRRLAQNHRLIGADVVGDWSPAVYGGGIIDAFAKQGEALLDQPWLRPGAARAHATNGRVNVGLLDMFAHISAS